MTTQSSVLKNKVVCQICFDKRKVTAQRIYNKTLTAGICIGCGKINNRNDKTLCFECNSVSVEKYRHRRKEVKLFIINYFGNKCKECGEMDIRCLSLDHINNDGSLDKKTKDGKRQVTPTWYAKLYKLLKDNQPLPRELQLLCFNCHAKKDLQPWWFKDGLE
jgi:ribosomal protein L32